MLISTADDQIKVLDQLVYYRTRAYGKRIEVAEHPNGPELQLLGFKEWPHESWDWKIKTNHAEMKSEDIKSLKYTKSGDKYLSTVRLSDRFVFKRK
jgi:hypothetical protein